MTISIGTLRSLLRTIPPEDDHRRVLIHINDPHAEYEWLETSSLIVHDGELAIGTNLSPTWGPTNKELPHWVEGVYHHGINTLQLGPPFASQFDAMQRRGAMDDFSTTAQVAEALTYLPGYDMGILQTQFSPGMFPPRVQDAIWPGIRRETITLYQQENNTPGVLLYHFSWSPNGDGVNRVVLHNVPADIQIGGNVTVYLNNYGNIIKTVDAIVEVGPGGKLPEGYQETQEPMEDEPMALPVEAAL